MGYELVTGKPPYREAELRRPILPELPRFESWDTDPWPSLYTLLQEVLEIRDPELEGRPDNQIQTMRQFLDELCRLQNRSGKEDTDLVFFSDTALLGVIGLAPPPAGSTEGFNIAAVERKASSSNLALRRTVERATELLFDRAESHPGGSPLEERFAAACAMIKQARAAAGTPRTP